MRPLIIALFMTTLTPFPLGSVTANTNMPGEYSAKQFLDGLIESNKAPSLQYIFADPGRILYEYHAGLADIAKGIPVERRTTFHGYSVTKTFTAAAVVKLAEQGTINLDDPISKYLSEFPYQASPTIRQTLQHLGGFPNPNPISWIHPAQEHSRFDSKTFIHRVLQDNDQLRSPPGEKFAYSNVGYLLLGEVVAKASGRPFEEYVVKEIIEPLRLTGDRQLAFTIPQPERHATGYIRRWNWLNGLLGWFIDRNQYLGPPVTGWVPFKPFYINGAAYGGLIGNADGFISYLQAILKGSAPFSQKGVDLLLTPARTNDGNTAPAGLAWLHGKLDGVRYFQHSGGAGGYYCEIRIYPDIRRASVIMTNNTGISRQGLLDQVDHFLLGVNNKP